MIKEFVLIILIQVPSATEAVFEIQAQEYFETMKACRIALEAKLSTSKAVSHQCLKISVD